MKIGIVGTGNVAQTLSVSLEAAGHSIVHGTRDVAATRARTDKDAFGNPPFATWLASHPSTKLATFAEAAAHGELIINATSGTVSLAALEMAGADNLAGKVLLDVANPLDFSAGFPPTLSVCNTDSLGEQIQKAFPEARVVKALNTMSATVMVDPASVPGDHDVLIAGDDPEAKAIVSKLIAGALGWPAGSILDLGDISMARGTEMLLPIWVRLYGKLGTPAFNFHIARAS